MIVALGGRPWTGKTTLARALAKSIPGVLLDMAALRRVLFPRLVTASPEQNDRLYEFLLQAAVWHLETAPGSVIVLDGRSLTRVRDVLSLRCFASGIGQTLHIIECVCPDKVAAQRAKAQATEPRIAHDPLAGLLDEPVEPIPEPKIVVDTLLPPARCLSLVLEGIAGGRVNGHPEAGKGSRRWAGAAEDRTVGTGTASPASSYAGCPQQ